MKNYGNHDWKLFAQLLARKIYKPKGFNGTGIAVKTCRESVPKKSLLHLFICPLLDYCQQHTKIYRAVREEKLREYWEDKSRLLDYSLRRRLKRLLVVCTTPLLLFFFTRDWSTDINKARAIQSLKLRASIEINETIRYQRMHFSIASIRRKKYIYPYYKCHQYIFRTVKFLLPSSLMHIYTCEWIFINYK